MPNTAPADAVRKRKSRLPKGTPRAAPARRRLSATSPAASSRRVIDVNSWSPVTPAAWMTPRIGGAPSRSRRASSASHVRRREPTSRATDLDGQRRAVPGHGSRSIRRRIWGRRCRRPSPASAATGFDRQGPDGGRRGRRASAAISRPRAPKAAGDEVGRVGPAPQRLTHRLTA